MVRTEQRGRCRFTFPFSCSPNGPSTAGWSRPPRCRRPSCPPTHLALPRRRQRGNLQWKWLETADVPPHYSVKPSAGNSSNSSSSSRRPKSSLLLLVSSFSFSFSLSGADILCAFINSNGDKTMFLTLFAFFVAKWCQSLLIVWPQLYRQNIPSWTGKNIVKNTVGTRQWCQIWLYS